MPKSVKQARKETKQLKSSVRGMLQDRLDQGKPIPASARKQFPKLKSRQVGPKQMKGAKRGLAKSKSRLAKALEYE